MFIAYVKQAGEGCDYTIGCGQTLWKLEATNYTEAVTELHCKVIGQWLPEYCDYEEGYWGEDKLGRIVLFEVISKEEMLLKTWYAEAKIYKEEAIKAREKEAERAEFERLKAKFEE